MVDLVSTPKLGDITFGAPADIELLHQPWGFFEFLGVPKNASKTAIKKAYRKLAREKFHPDIGGNHETGKTLNMVYETLTDNGGDLGPEYSQRRQYWRVSTLDEYFDGFIEYEGDRTKKLSEIMLIRMQYEKEEAEAHQRLEDQDPRFKELKKKLRRARSLESKQKIIEEMKDISAEAAGLTQEEKEKIDKRREEQKERHLQEEREFVEQFSRSARSYFDKVLDAFYLGGERIVFGHNPQKIHFGIAHHEDRDHVIELVLAGDCYISGFSQVHFKAPEANVTINDPNVTGIYHVVKGSIAVDLEKSSYGNVIRARAPNVTVVQGFVQRGDFYVPEGFASEGWWDRKPVLDLAVQKGSITLDLRSPVVADRGYSYLKEIIRNDSYNIFKENNYKISKF